jgi:hypothetical protein
MYTFKKGLAEVVGPLNGLYKTQSVIVVVYTYVGPLTNDDVKYILYPLGKLLNVDGEYVTTLGLVGGTVVRLKVAFGRVANVVPVVFVI